MNAPDYEAFARTLKQAFLLWPNDYAGDDLVENWYRRLQAFSLEDVARALQRLLPRDGEQKCPFARLMQEAKVQRNKRAWHAQQAAAAQEAQSALTGRVEPGAMAFNPDEVGHAHPEVLRRAAAHYRQGLSVRKACVLAVEEVARRVVTPPSRRRAIAPQAERARSSAPPPGTPPQAAPAAYTAHVDPAAAKTQDGIDALRRQMAGIGRDMPDLPTAGRRAK